MLSHWTLIMSAAVATAICPGNAASAAPMGGDVRPARPAPGEVQLAQSPPKLTGKAAVDALPGNTLVPIPPEGGASFYIQANGVARSLEEDGTDGGVTGWKINEGMFCFTFEPREPTLNCTPEIYVVGDTVTFVGVNNYTSSMRIVKGNVKNMK